MNDNKRENRSKTITMRIRPSIHKILSEKAKEMKISLSKYMIETSLEKCGKEIPHTCAESNNH